MIRSHETIMYWQFRAALSAVDCPMGHNSGAYKAIYDEMWRLCPTIAAEEARKSQRTWDDGLTEGT